MVEPSFESCNRVLEAWPNRLRSLYVLLDRQLLKLPWTTGNLAHKPKCIRNESGFPQRRQAKTKEFTDECIAARSCFSFDATNATRITSTNSQSPTITIRATESWIETVQTEEDSLQAAEEDSSASDSIDLFTVKGMLHAAQLEAREKSGLSDRLNEE